MELTAAELQKLVLMTGSKKALGTYLGLNPQETNELWEKNQLKKPLTWLRGQTRTEQLELLAKAGSLKKLADRLACSEAALRPIFMGEPTRELHWSSDFLVGELERYKSVRLTAHMHDTTESLVRRCADRHGLDLGELTDYSFSNHQNGKGRRAELEFARLRGERITADRNRLDGPQAAYDFDDEELGRVNVKSSRQWKYKARSRQGNPQFWKCSTRGANEADTIVCLCYDAKGDKLLGVFRTKAADLGLSSMITITAPQLEAPSAISAGNVTG